MDPNQTAEKGRPLEVNKLTETGKENSVQKPRFEKAKGKLRSTVSAIKQAFGKLKAESPQVALGPEQDDLDQLSGDFDKLNQETEQQLGEASNPQEAQERQPLTGVERATQKLKELAQMKDKNMFPTVGMLVDGDEIKGQLIRFIKKPDRIAVHFKTRDSMTAKIADTVIPGLPPQDVKSGLYDLSKYGSGDHCWIIKVDKDTTIYISKGSFFEKLQNPKYHLDTDKVYGKYFNHEQEASSLKGAIRIEIKGTQKAEQIAQKVNLAFQKIQISDALIPPSQESERKYKEACFRSQRRLEGDQAWKEFREKYQSEHGRDILDHLQREEVFPGYSTAVDEDAWKGYRKIGKFYLNHNLKWMSSIEPDFASIFSYGLLSGSERAIRWKQSFVNWNTERELISGGSDSVFISVFEGFSEDLTINSKQVKIINGTISGDKLTNWGGLDLILNPKILDRTDWYASLEDHSGSTHPQYFNNRSSPEEFFKSFSSARHNEIMMPKGIPVEMIDGLLVDTAMQKDIIIERVRSKGIRNVRGIPIEDFIRVKKIKD